MPLNCADFGRENIYSPVSSGFGNGKDNLIPKSYN